MSAFKVEQFNSALMLAFQELKKQGFLQVEKGDSADARLRACIESKAGLPVVGAQAWKESREFAMPRSLVKQDVFFFPEHDFQSPFLVDKPNGKQSWPDCMVVFRKSALPIEFKRSESGIILWNSGLPRPNSIYVYNGRDTRNEGTTFFLGQSILTAREMQYLSEAEGANKDIANRFNSLLNEFSNWSIYARAMFNNPEKPLSSEKRIDREAAVMEFLLRFKWDIDLTNLDSHL